MGNPFPRPLATVTRSAVTPWARLSSSSPQRPMPVWISSIHSRVPVREVISRAAARYPSGAGITPDSPWTGSMTTAATVSSTADSRAPASPKGTNVTSPGSGSKGFRYFSVCVTASAPMVRPWKDPSIATRRVRPVRRLTLNAASLASAPELARKTLPPPAASERRSASRICGSEAKKFERCPRALSCLATAFTTAGCACPRALTAIPASRST